MYCLLAIFAHHYFCADAFFPFNFFSQGNAEICRDRRRATRESRVSCSSSSAIAAAAAATATVVGIGVEGVASAWSAQKGRQSPSPPLASRRLDLASDAAAASFDSVAAAIALKCAAVKGAAAVDAATPRPPRIYLPPLVAETSKENAMEPETKEEDERRSSTPSPEVASFSPVIEARSFFV